MDGSTIEIFLPRFRSTIFMGTEESFMTARKPDVSSELVLGLLAFASLFPAPQFARPYYLKLRNMLPSSLFLHKIIVPFT
jgi:hypothetical protein